MPADNNKKTEGVEAAQHDKTGPGWLICMHSTQWRLGRLLFVVFFLDGACKDERMGEVRVGGCEGVL
jgi:hypothetical protein